MLESGSLHKGIKMDSTLRAFFSSAANWFTLLRLILAPALWILAFKGDFQLVAYGLIAVIVTDILDGQLARLLDQCSKLGERLDSLADHIIMISSVIWLVMARRDIITARRSVFIPVVIFYLITILLGLIKSGRFGGAHILEAKLFGLFGYLFLIVSFFGYYHEWIFISAMASWVLHSSLNILYLYRSDLFDERFHSLIFGLMGVEIKSKLFKILF